MRTSLIIFGVIFLVIGILLYILPMQEIKANTVTTEGGEVDTRTSSAKVIVPLAWTFAVGTIGLALLMLGLLIPDRVAKNNSRKDSYDKIIESKENVKMEDGKKIKHKKYKNSKVRSQR